MHIKQGRILFSLLGVLLPQAFILNAAPVVTKLAAGGAHSLFMKSNGSLWGTGDNFFGELGAGFSITSTNKPLQIVPSGVSAIAAGDYHSLYRQSDGSLWAMGQNTYGQLGDTTTNNHYFPEQVVGSQVSVLIAAGSDHSLFATFHNPIGPGNFWAMGFNGSGQLGDSTTSNTNQPELILSVAHSGAVSAIAAGIKHSLFVKPDGSLWAMGFNGYGQLGDGTATDRHSAVEIVSSNVTAVAAGGYHSLFIKSDGSLWAMGDNGAGELGDNSQTQRKIPEQVQFNGVTAVAAGEAHSLFLKSDGSLWAMGYNFYGQLGDGTTNDSHVPKQIVPSNVTAVSAGESSQPVCEVRRQSLGHG